MAEFPAPQPATSTSAAPVTAALIAYLLIGVAAVLDVARSGLATPAPILSIVGIVAVIICYVKRDDAAGTWVASHLTWLIRTFWWSLLWGIVGFVIYGLGAALFFLIIPLIGIPIASAIWIVTAIWVIYRVVKGYLLFKDSRPIPGV